MVPVKRDGRAASSCSATWPACAKGTMPGEYDRYNMRRVVSMTANIEGEDLGRVGRPRRSGAIAGPASRRAACTVDVRGQIVPMQQMFQRPGGRPGAWRWS